MQVWKIVQIFQFLNFFGKKEIMDGRERERLRLDYKKKSRISFTIVWKPQNLKML